MREGGRRGVPVGLVEGEMKGLGFVPREKGLLPPLKDAARMAQRGDPMAERGRRGAIGDPVLPKIFLKPSSVLHNQTHH